MIHKKSLGYYLEDLWSKGFKLSDEDVHFIYFGKYSINTPDWKVMIALKATLQFQQTFDPGFFIGILEHISHPEILTAKEAWLLLEEKGLSKEAAET
ncbi:DUF6123 family protein [Thalassobacillus sp. CUG 92003]|uniref:DUF6123 family protein n=1 Tax=Thalassobacillus sp. CUG 92003 TaxID=2736641 RepID=UPI0015E68977|nr:DUF6123 family protein [Thalassobacillus sp. CUG 92003]